MNTTQKIEGEELVKKCFEPTSRIKRILNYIKGLFKKPIQPKDEVLLVENMRQKKRWESSEARLGEFITHLKQLDVPVKHDDISLAREMQKERSKKKLVVLERKATYEKASKEWAKERKEQEMERLKEENRAFIQWLYPEKVLDEEKERRESAHMRFQKVVDALDALQSK